MKTLYACVAVCIISCLSACVIRPDIRSIRSGVLKKGLHLSAFESEWGQPDKTFICDGKSFKVINHYTGDIVDRTRDFECWSYDRFGVMLVFDENSLSGWQTDKTVNQLKEITLSDK